MKLTDILTEGKNHPSIVVDVQPEYAQGGGHAAEDTCNNIIQFVNDQTGPVLMFVNAEDQGASRDTVQDIKIYWEEHGFNPEGWDRVKIVDKGFGYFRSWMDQGVDPSAIIKVIRAMYQQKTSDSGELFKGDESPTYEEDMTQLLGSEFKDWMVSDPISVGWTSVAQLKKFGGAYLVGGGRDECLREVELLMNAFNIGYRRIDSLVY